MMGEGVYEYGPTQKKQQIMQPTENVSDCFINGEYLFGGSKVMSKILCFCGFHKYKLRRVIHRGVSSALMGHSCVRCGKIPKEEIAVEQLMEQLR